MTCMPPSAVRSEEGPWPRVGFAIRIVCDVCVLVMKVVKMPTLMLYHIVLVFLLMRFRQVQIKPQRHQYRRADQGGRDLFPKHGYRQNRADKRGGREVCAR